MIDEKLKQYAERFDDGFPMFQLGMSRSDAEVIEIIDQCLTAGKDVYELGYLSTEPDDLY